MDPKIIRSSKFLSLVLRHKPESIGLRLDKEGWADVADLIAAANSNGNELDFESLVRVVHENDKKRFTFSDDGTRIRANQGHSIDVDLGLTAVEPPTVLYHGTVARFMESIDREGLLPQNRQFVHLSADISTAKIVGSRRGKPFVLTIASARMKSDGFEFFRSKNGVWLTAHVPPKYLSKDDSTLD